MQRSARESIVADQVAQHPQNVGGLGAVVDGGDGAGERLSSAVARAGGLGKRQRVAAGFERRECLVAALSFRPDGAQKFAVPSFSHEVEGLIHAWVMACARTELSWSGGASRRLMASSVPLPKAHRRDPAGPAG